MWLPYSDTYDVSDDGQVRNNKTGRILKPILSNKENKFHVNLCHNGNKKTIDIHRLVALRFLPKIDIDLEVDHIDRNHHNNNASNLRWVSRSCNLRNKLATHISIVKYGKNKDLIGFQVKFEANNQIIYRKFFKTMEEAINARNAFKASEEYLSIS